MNIGRKKNNWFKKVVKGKKLGRAGNIAKKEANKKLEIKLFRETKSNKIN